MLPSKPTRTWLGANKPSLHRTQGASKGVLAAGTEGEASAPVLPGAPPPAWLHGPGAFSTLEQK
jgi:hypothetical protein